MHSEHRFLLDEIKKAGPPRTGALENDSYGGSGHPYYRVSVPDRRRLARAWVSAHKAMAPTEVLAVVDSLFQGESHEEKTLAALLLAYHPKARAAATTAMFDAWLGHLNGWVEVDSLCQNVFTPKEMLADWPAWSGLIGRLGRDGDINRRRAALVLLTRPVSVTDDTRFTDLAFDGIERMKAERDILITKAVSWLLRSMAGRHGALVRAYLEANLASLPAIAVRETRVKLATGVKSGKPRRPDRHARLSDPS